jgi:Holliday junction resolvase RusA-like endonuclease
MIIEIPGKPGAWQRARSNGKVRFDSAKQKQNKANLAYFAGEAMGNKPPLEVPLSVVVTAIWPWPKGLSAKRREAHHGFFTGRPDGDNVMKLIGDALNDIVWRDDSQIVEHAVRKVYGDRPRTIISIVEA